jgi:hypothetical protein
LTGEGWGEGEESRNFNKLFTPLPIIPSRQGRGNFTFYDSTIFDDLVKSLERRISVIPANPGSRPGQAPESSYFKYLKILWTPVSTGVTTFYETISFYYIGN